MTMLVFEHATTVDPRPDLGILHRHRKVACPRCRSVVRYDDHGVVLHQVMGPHPCPGCLPAAEPQAEVGAEVVPEPDVVQVQDEDEEPPYEEPPVIESPPDEEEAPEADACGA